MSRIDELIAEHCPEGVDFRPLAEITSKSTGIKWASVADASFKYIDLSSVDRVTRRIGETVSVTAADAPSRARQVVRTGDVIFATTRPTQMRWAVIPEEYDEQIASTGYCVLRPNNDVILTNFLAHILGTGNFSRYVESNQVEGNYPSIPDSRIREFKVPVPPLEIQREIVRILDTFSKMEVELEVELEARKQQYEHYRNKFFQSRDGVLNFSLSSHCDFRRGTAITKKKAIPGPVPVVANGPVPSYTHNQRNRDANTIVVARSGAYAGLVSYWEEPIFLTDAFSVHPDEKRLSSRYVFHALQAVQSQLHGMKKGAGVPHVRVKEIQEFSIPVPSKSEQERVSDLLDKFDTLVNDLSIGLPAELAARRQQYEYYRDKLLTFKELEPAS